MHVDFCVCVCLTEGMYLLDYFLAALGKRLLLPLAPDML